MPKSDPHFSHLSSASREEVFERLQIALNVPLIEDCFKSVLKELGTVARIALLDPRLQIEAVLGNPDVPSRGAGAPTWAFPVHRQMWIKEFVDVRPATKVLLLLFQPDIELLPREEVMEDLRHELGHTFLYLRDPEVKEDCVAADEEWKKTHSARGSHRSNTTRAIEYGGMSGKLVQTSRQQEMDNGCESEPVLTVQQFSNTQVGSERL